MSRVESSWLEMRWRPRGGKVVFNSAAITVGKLRAGACSTYAWRSKVCRHEAASSLGKIARAERVGVRLKASVKALLRALLAIISRSMAA